VEGRVEDILAASRARLAAEGIGLGMDRKERGKVTLVFSVEVLHFPPTVVFCCGHLLLCGSNSEVVFLGIDDRNHVSDGLSVGEGMSGGSRDGKM